MTNCWIAIIENNQRACYFLYETRGLGGREWFHWTTTDFLLGFCQLFFFLRFSSVSLHDVYVCVESTNREIIIRNPDLKKMNINLWKQSKWEPGVGIRLSGGRVSARKGAGTGWQWLFHYLLNRDKLGIFLLSLGFCLFCVLCFFFHHRKRQ